MLVREWMSSPPIVVSARLAAPGALWLMEERQIRRLPVLDDDGRVVGIVTRGDLQRRLGPFPISWPRLKMKVADVMTPAPALLAPDDPLEKAAEIMLERKISGVPVVEQGRTVGIITESDVFRAFCRAMGVGKAQAA